MVLFCAVVEQGGLTAAAKHLGHTPSHVSKELARLEKRLGSRLLHRTTRRIGLTETGRIYYENARRVVADATVIEERIQTLGDRPYGELKISVPVVFAQGCFSAWMPEFMNLHPDVDLNIDVSDRRADMIAEGFDLVVRIGDLPSSELVARELFRTTMPALAAPVYLSERGAPHHPRDLADHALIAFTGDAVAHSWSFRGSGGSSITVDVSPRVRCNEADMERTLVLAGQGIARLPAFAYAAELSDGSLVRVLADYEPPAVGVHLIYPNRQHLPPKTRAMADFLIEKTATRFKGRL